MGGRGVTRAAVLAVLVVAAAAVPPAAAGRRIASGAAEAVEAGKAAGKTYLQSVLDSKPVVNNRPIIGILSQPCHECPGDNYVAAAYVKWIEMAGGRAAPIQFMHLDDNQLRSVFDSLNGLVFPGGLTWLWLDAPYVIAARKLFNWAVEANDNGEVFPIHGTCLGHQLLQILVSNVSRNTLLVETDAVSQATILEFTEAEKDSTMFRYLSDDLKVKIGNSDLNLTIENHEYGVPPDHFEKWPILSEWYTILSTTKDRKGLEYISSIEAKKYPFFGTQWHPEKPPFEFSDLAIPHVPDSIDISYALAKQFIEFARRSTHKPTSLLGPGGELEMLIYNYPPVFTARVDAMERSYDGPDLTYFFDGKPLPDADASTREDENDVNEDKDEEDGSVVTEAAAEEDVIGDEASDLDIDSNVAVA